VCLGLVESANKADGLYTLYDLAPVTKEVAVLGGENYP